MVFLSPRYVILVICILIVGDIEASLYATRNPYQTPPTKKPKPDDDCTLNLQVDFNKPSPVFIRGSGLMSPDQYGYIYIRNNERITLACLDDRRKNSFVVNGAKIPYNQPVLTVSCRNKVFVLDHNNAVVNFKDITCTYWPKTSIEPATRPQGNLCNAANSYYKVGYQVAGTFYSIYEVCFDGNNLNTDYVKSKITPWSILSHQEASRTFRYDKAMFKNIDMAKIYTKVKQQERFEQVLGASTTTANQTLDIGHLSAFGDFAMTSEQYATMEFINSGPQWSTLNRGIWANLERALRAHAYNKRLHLAMYTGTHGVLELPDTNHIMRQMYLYGDRSGNVAVPIPEYFYKVVYDQATKTAIAFVAINVYNNALTPATIQNLKFCPNKCADSDPTHFGGLTPKWRERDNIVFCCEYRDFVNRVKNFNLDVRGLMYIPA